MEQPALGPLVSQPRVPIRLDLCCVLCPACLLPPVQTLTSAIPTPANRGAPRRPPRTRPSHAKTALPLGVAWGPPEPRSEAGTAVARCGSPGLLCAGYSPFLASCQGHLVRAWGHSALAWVQKAFVCSCGCSDQAERRPGAGGGSVSGGLWAAHLSRVSVSLIPRGVSQERSHTLSTVSLRVI